MDRLLAMEAFVRVSDAGGFSAAARAWGRSKASTSKLVAQLEAHLGVRLLQRTTRSVGLTAAGRRHLPACRAALALIEDAESELRAAHAGLSGPLRVTAPPGLFDRYRAALVDDFLREHPAVELDLVLTHRLVDLVEAGVDVALRVTKPDDSSLVARRLSDAPLVLVAAPTLFAARAAPATPAALADWPCLVDTNFRFGARWPLRGPDGRADVRVSGPVRVDSPLVLIALARAGHGIGLTPRMLVEDDLRDGTLVEVLPGAVDVGWSVWAVTSQRRHRTARARAWLDHVQAVFAGAAPA